MNKFLKNSYKRFWVPFMGRLISLLIPFFEGRPIDKPPTYDIDREKYK